MNLFVMQLSIVILAGGKAKRLGVDKALIVIKNKALIAHTFEKIHSISDDILIITKTDKRQKKLKQVIKNTARFFLDEDPRVESPLIGALTGFKNAVHKLVLLIGCDMPLIKPEVIKLLYDHIIRVGSLCWAVVPRFPNRYIEPLCAIYSKEQAKKALEQAIIDKSFKMKKFIDLITATHYFPIARIKPIDPELQTFFNVNTREDIIKLLRILEESDSI
ncbi:MAG: molybdenum cofactor guanylyltransferase [Promethearchaeota archaeon]